MKFTRLNWHPMKDNPLDYTEMPLVQFGGAVASLTREGILDEYVLRIDGHEVERTRSIMMICAALNQHEIGLPA